MFYNIIFAFTIILSIAVMIFIISKKMPMVEMESKMKVNAEKKGKKQSWKFSYRKILHIFIYYCERFFRIIKIWALKLDTKISKWLQKLNNLKKKNAFSREKVEEDGKELISQAEKVHFSQLKNLTPPPKVQSNINIARILGEKEKKTIKKVEIDEAIVEVSDVDLFTEKECIEMIAKNPRNIRAYNTLADIYIKQKNFVDAKSSLQQILKFDANNVDAKLKLRKLRDLQNKGK